MMDKSIGGALTALRKQIMRRNMDGLERAETLLALRGVELRPVLPAKSTNVARSGHMAAIVLNALRDNGPQPARWVKEYMAARRPEIGHADAPKRFAMALSNLNLCGLVGREGRVWRLA